MKETKNNDTNACKEVFEKNVESGGLIYGEKNCINRFNFYYSCSSNIYRMYDRKKADEYGLSKQWNWNKW